MKAVVIKDKLQVVDVPKPCYTGEESLIQLIKAGICQTDMEILCGYMGFKGVLGHEFVGIVEASRNPYWMGKRVVGEINCGCGKCEFCNRKMQRHCLNRSVLGIFNRDGAFQDYFTLPEENLHVVPDSVSNEDAIFVEPLAAVCEILDQVSIQPNELVAILGDGKLGLLIAMVLVHTGCRLYLIGKHKEKMDLVRDLNIELIESRHISQLDRKFDYVIDACGSADGWNQALKLIKPRGTVILKSTYHDQISINPSNVVVDEITLIGSRCGRFEVALKFLEEKKVSPSRLLQHNFSISQALDAFKKAQESGVLKVTLESE